MGSPGLLKRGDDCAGLRHGGLAGSVRWKMRCSSLWLKNFLGQGGMEFCMEFSNSGRVLHLSKTLSYRNV